MAYAANIIVEENDTNMIAQQSEVASSNRAADAMKYSMKYMAADFMKYIQELLKEHQNK